MAAGSMMPPSRSPRQVTFYRIIGKLRRCATMRGCRNRSEVAVNIRHISELIDAAVWLSAIDLPVRLICADSAPSQATQFIGSSPQE
jgi:hypothetical protein